MNAFTFEQPASIEAALGAGGSFIAGGTNLIDLMKYHVASPAKLVDIQKLDALKSISELPDGGVRLGALVTNAQTAHNPVIVQRYPLLSRAILAGASAQIRNMATNGGNLLQRTRCYYFYDTATPCNKREPGTGCSALGGYNRNAAILGASVQCIAVYPSDMSVALAALEAVVQVKGPAGERSIAFHDFHRLPGNHPEQDNTLQPGELVTAIDLPPQGFHRFYSYLKIRDRASYAFALVSVATGFELEHGKIIAARFALGGVAHKPWRVPEAEACLIGKEPLETHFKQAAAMLLDGARGYEHNHFKINLAKKAIVRNAFMALEPDSQRPGAQPSI